MSEQKTWTYRFIGHYPVAGAGHDWYPGEEPKACTEEIINNGLFLEVLPDGTERPTRANERIAGPLDPVPADLKLPGVYYFPDETLAKAAAVGAVTVEPEDEHST